MGAVCSRSALDRPRESAKIKAAWTTEGDFVFVIIWSFQPRPERVSEFEAAYGSDGLWARLFRKSPDFGGTELLRASDARGVYLTIDRWRSRAAFEAFRAEHADEYQTVDRACESLTLEEQLHGEFDNVME